MTLEERRDILAATVRHVFVRQGRSKGGSGSVADRTHIVWRDEPDVDVPLRGARKPFPVRPFIFPKHPHRPA
jgi:hypothetical protein